MSLESEGFLTSNEVAELLRVPPATVRQWRYKGVGPRGYRVGRYIRYSPADIRDWLESQRDAER